MTVREMQDKILQLKKDKSVCILAHLYQRHEILEIADFVGDSFALSMQAKKASQNTVLMCGVRFMAETVKMLSPEKKVILSHSDAGCPMAEQIDREAVLTLKKKLGNAPVVAYVNTTADLKTVSDVCVTSSSAVKIVSNLPDKEIIFIPDINLGTYVQEQLPEKKIHLVHGGCPTHVRMTKQNVMRAKQEHPNALLLVHPECRKEVVDLADMVGSTAEIIEYVNKSNCDAFIIGTENSIVAHLQYGHPEKSFYPLSKDCICHNMMLTNLGDVLACLEGKGGEEIILSDEVIHEGRKCIDEMLRLG